MPEPTVEHPIGQELRAVLAQGRADNLLGLIMPAITPHLSDERSCGPLEQMLLPAGLAVQLAAISAPYRPGLFRALMSTLAPYLRTTVYVDELETPPQLTPTQVGPALSGRELEALPQFTQPPASPALSGPALSGRELQVLQGIARGRTNAEIGRELYLSEDTIKTHNRRLFAKLGARDRAQAVAIGFRRNLLPLDEPISESVA